MTSVKEFRIDEPPGPTRLGVGSFVFTDDYSVFDWGKMPDSIPQKGAALCAMGAANFELLEDDGLPTHYRGVVSSGDVMGLGAVSAPPREMAIDLAQTPSLPRSGGDYDYDYDAFHEAAGENYLIPLEVVFRNTVPVGSSLRDRAEPSEFGLAMAEWPDDPVTLPDTVVEFSTKFEASDRYLSRDEAGVIAGNADLDRLAELARLVNLHITERAAEVGLDHEDGKIECLYFRGDIRVADVVGTFDENRFAYRGQQISKEVIRQYYKRTQPEWVAAVESAKARAKDEGVADWRDLCTETPDPLADHVIDTVRDLYTAGANAYLGRDLFDSPSLDEAVDRIREL